MQNELEKVDVAVMYASVSGRSRNIAQAISDRFATSKVELLDLRDGIKSMPEAKLIVMGSPTYGIGEWHYLWANASQRLIDWDKDWRSQYVALFALGDAKHHPETFAGAINHLNQLVTKLGAKLIGPVPYDESYELEKCESFMKNGYFPGLVIDQINQRSLSIERVRKWVGQLKVQASL